jgi:peptidoglycan/LPS O-acetylase OafA/YrhL
VGWFFLGHAFWLTTGVGTPVPEAAASHWFTWALGALAVEAMFGLVQLPKWCRNLFVGGLAIVVASAISVLLPFTAKDTLLHDLLWMLMHPMWGFGFFVMVNRAVQAERSWLSNASTRVRENQPRLVTVAAIIGAFSYSLYLTHELVIIQSWKFTIYWFPPMVNTLLVTVPATVAFAWLFYRYCEKPYMKKAAPRMVQPETKPPLFVQNTSPLVDEA